MKKVLPLIALLACLAAGCTKQESMAVPQSITLTYWTFDEAYKAYMEQCVTRYNTENEISIQLVTNVYSMDELDYKLWASLQTGIGAPDLVDIEQSHFGRYMNPRNNYLTPLNSIIDGKKEGILPLSYSKYQSKGFYYGIDYYENNCVVFYNQEVLKRAGIDPASIETFNDFTAAGSKLYAAEKLPLLSVDYTDDILFETLLLLSGTGYCTPEGETLLASPQTAEILTLLNDMVHEQKIAELAPSGEFFSYDFFHYFKQGRAGAVIAPFWYASYMEKYMPELAGKVYVAPLPRMREEITGVQLSGVATAITIQCEDPITAKNLLRDTRFDQDSLNYAYSGLMADPISDDAYTGNAFRRLCEGSSYFANNPYDVLSRIRESAAVPNLCGDYYEIASEVAGGGLFQVLKEQQETPEEALGQISRMFE